MAKASASDNRDRAKVPTLDPGEPSGMIVSALIRFECPELICWLARDQPLFHPTAVYTYADTWIRARARMYVYASAREARDTRQRVIVIGDRVHCKTGDI